MAGLLLEPWDYQTTGQILQTWTQLFGSIQTGTIALTTAAGARGTHGIQFDHGSNIVGSTAGLSITLPNIASTKVILGSNFITAYFNDDGNLIGGVPAGAIFTVFDAGGYQLRVKTNIDGTLTVWGGGNSQMAGAVALGTTARALQQNIQYYLWLEAVIDNAGSIILMVNGDVWLSLPVVDTQYSATSTYKWNVVAIGPASGINTYGYDDTAVFDGATAKNNTIPCGRLALQSYYFNAPGTYSQFTPLVPGPNVDMIKEGSPTGGIGNDGDTTYNASSNNGDMDTFIGAVLPPSITGIIAVQRNIISRASSGSASVAGVYRRGGVDYVGPSTGVTTSYGNMRDVLDSNPAGGDWAPAQIGTPNEWGNKKTA